MDRKLEIIVPHLLLVSSLIYFFGKGGNESLWGLAIAAALWVLSMMTPKDQPTKLEKELKALEKQVDHRFGLLSEQHVELKSVVYKNAEYSATEFGTIKTAMQIKQLGR